MPRPLSIPNYACRKVPNHVKLFRRRNISLKSDGYPQDFTFLPDFFTLSEQRVLLSVALHKLDATESRQCRKRRKEYAIQQSRLPSGSLSERPLFFPDDYYAFEEGHYDGVIRRFREMHVSSWPSDVPGLSQLLDRLRNIHPDEDTQTHLLHLASDGEILAHLDNLEASGSWILGVSLGSTRILRLQGVADPTDSYDLLLPPGSVYMQRDSIRYGYKHSILKDANFRGTHITCGQRFSIMIRNRLSHTE